MTSNGSRCKLRVETCAADRQSPQESRVSFGCVAQFGVRWQVKIIIQEQKTVLSQFTMQSHKEVNHAGFDV